MSKKKEVNQVQNDEVKKIIPVHINAGKWRKKKVDYSLNSILVCKYKNWFNSWLSRARFLYLLHECLYVCYPHAQEVELSRLGQTSTCVLNDRAK